MSETLNIMQFFFLTSNNLFSDLSTRQGRNSDLFLFTKHLSNHMLEHTEAWLKPRTQTMNTQYSCRSRAEAPQRYPSSVTCDMPSWKWSEAVKQPKAIRTFQNGYSLDFSWRLGTGISQFSSMMHSSIMGPGTQHFCCLNHNPLPIICSSEKQRTMTSSYQTSFTSFPQTRRCADLKTSLPQTF